MKAESLGEAWNSSSEEPRNKRGVYVYRTIICSSMRRFVEVSRKTAGRSPAQPEACTRPPAALQTREDRSAVQEDLLRSKLYRHVLRTVEVHYLKSKLRTSAVSSTNLGSILIFSTCVVGTCNIL